MQPDPAITSRFHAERPCRGAADVQRSAPMTFLPTVFSILLVLLPTTASAQGTSGGGMNLIGNGSFESANLSPWFWSICFSQIVAEPQHVADGSNCAIVCGKLYQDVNVVPGTMYQLEFAFGGDDQAQANRAPLTVSWGTQIIAAIPVDPISMTSPNWRYLTFDFLATTSTTRLSFSTLPSQAFPLIDNVSLTAVPEPGAVTLFAVAGLTGFAIRRRHSRYLRMARCCGTLTAAAAPVAWQFQFRPIVGATLSFCVR